MSELTDNDLIPMLKSSDKTIRNKALKDLYRVNYPRIATHIKNNSGNPEDAEDIFQDGLIALYQQVTNGTFQGNSSLNTYLFSICKNLWLKRLRKSSTSKEGFELDPEIATDENLAIDDLIADETTKALADLLDKLKGDCKKILLLFYYEKRRMVEIAKIMGFANDQVAKNKKNRCLKELRVLATQLPNF